MFLGGHTDRDPVKLFRRCGSEEALFIPREVVPKQTPDIIKTETRFSPEGTSCIRCPQNGCPFQLRHLTETSKSASWTKMELSTRSSFRITKMEPNGSMLQI